MVKIRFWSDPGALFGRQESTKEQDQSRKEFEDYIVNLHDFLVNQMIEVIVFGLLANVLLQRWLVDGDL